LPSTHALIAFVACRSSGVVASATAAPTASTATTAATPRMNLVVIPLLSSMTGEVVVPPPIAGHQGACA
jgi:hypothetical protein